MNDPSTLRAQADAVVRSFVTTVLGAGVEDVPMLRLALGAIATPSSPDAFTRSLAEVRPRAPGLVAGARPTAREALDRLGALIESLDRRTDEEVLLELRAFSRLMIAALE